jgi:hypothetical protein
MSGAAGWSETLSGGAGRRVPVAAAWRRTRDDEREFAPALRAIARARQLAPQLRLLGRVYSLLGGVVVCGALVLSVVLSSAALFARGALPGEWLALGGALVGVLALIGAPWLALGFGLHRGRAWARSLGVVLGVMLLPFAPLGTALGIWTLAVVLAWRPDLARAAGE